MFLGSGLVDWWRAARPLVFGFCIFSMAKSTPGAACCGRIKSDLFAAKTSPMRSTPTQAKAMAPAPAVHPQRRLRVIIAIRTEVGAAWRSWGSSTTQLKARSQAAPTCLRSVGRRADTAFMSNGVVRMLSASQMPNAASKFSRLSLIDFRITRSACKTVPARLATRSASQAPVGQRGIAARYGKKTVSEIQRNLHLTWGLHLFGGLWCPKQLGIQARTSSQRAEGQIQNPKSGKRWLNGSFWRFSEIQHPSPGQKQHTARIGALSISA